MSTEESSSVGEMLESKTEDSPLKLEKQLAGDVHINGNVLKENGLCDDGNVLEESTNEQLLLMVIELKFQNEFFKSQFEGLKSQQEAEESGQESGESADVKELREKIQSLNRELNEEKQTRGAAEIALEHLREEYSDTDAKAQELSLKLAEGQIPPPPVYLEVLKIYPMESFLLRLSAQLVKNFSA
jgi:predicted RNase H-like nuclease (RuvC/YqgF family)